MTVADVDDSADELAILEAARRELTPLLPFRFAVDVVALHEEQDGGTWHEPASFPLA